MEKGCLLLKALLVFLLCSTEVTVHPCACFFFPLSRCFSSCSRPLSFLVAVSSLGLVAAQSRLDPSGTRVLCCSLALTLTPLRERANANNQLGRGDPVAEVPACRKAREGNHRALPGIVRRSPVCTEETGLQCVVRVSQPLWAGARAGAR